MLSSSPSGRDGFCLRLAGQKLFISGVHLPSALINGTVILSPLGELLSQLTCFSKNELGLKILLFCSSQILQPEMNKNKEGGKKAEDDIARSLVPLCPAFSGMVVSGTRAGSAEQHWSPGSRVLCYLNGPEMPSQGRIPHWQAELYSAALN